MDNHAFYFINHTRKEFDAFSNKKSICETLSYALNNYKGWQNSDDIRIGSEDINTTTCLEYLYTMGYKLSKLKNKN